MFLLLSAESADDMSKTWYQTHFIPIFELAGILSG